MIVNFVISNGLACYFIYLLIVRLKMCTMHQGVLGLVMYEGQLNPGISATKSRLVECTGT